MGSIQTKTNQNQRLLRRSSFKEEEIKSFKCMTPPSKLLECIFIGSVFNYSYKTCQKFVEIFII